MSQFEVMACCMSLEKLCSGTQVLGGPVAVALRGERGGLVFAHNRFGARGVFGELVVGRVLRKGARLRRRATRVAGLASESGPLAGVESLNPRDVLTSDSKKDGEERTEGDSEDGDGEPTASPTPWMTDEEAQAVVSEVILTGDDLSVIEYSGNEEAREVKDPHPLNSMADSLLNRVNGEGRGFSLTDVGGLWKTGEQAGEMKVPEMSASGFDVKEGVSSLAQWTSTELTMQHSQLARIATDVFYLQIAFSFFGGVRVVEALVNVFSTSPPDLGKLKELLNALDPFTISWLAGNVRQPLEELLAADPLDLENVVTLKSNVWGALHAFYERQWKVVS